MQLLVKEQFLAQARELLYLAQAREPLYLAQGLAQLRAKEQQLVLLAKYLG